MANGGTCCMRNGWDQSFLDSDPVLGCRQFLSRNRESWSRSCSRSMVLTDNPSSSSSSSSSPFYVNSVYQTPEAKMFPERIQGEDSRRHCSQVTATPTSPSGHVYQNQSRFLSVLPKTSSTSSSISSYGDVSGDDCTDSEQVTPTESKPTMVSHLPAWLTTKFITPCGLQRLKVTFHQLSLCNFYLGKMSFNEAKLLLRRFPVGTFLLRDSSDDRFPFSLSVQTMRGVTSIRVIYESGMFRLDCAENQIHTMPAFDCVLQLVQFYVRFRTNDRHRLPIPHNFVLLEQSGQRDTPVILRIPYENKPPSLAHLCRKRINGILAGKNVNRLQLIPSLKKFLTDYPYDI